MTCIFSTHARKLTTSTSWWNNSLPNFLSTSTLQINISLVYTLPLWSLDLYYCRWTWKSSTTFSNLLTSRHSLHKTIHCSLNGSYMVWSTSVLDLMYALISLKLSPDCQLSTAFKPWLIFINYWAPGNSLFVGNGILRIFQAWFFNLDRQGHHL